MSEAKATNIYDFKLILIGLDELTPEIAEKLGAAGLEDANLCSRRGGVSADFERESESFEQAVISAMEDIRRADVGVTGFLLENQDIAVSASEVARRIGKSRQAVSLYIAGKRGSGFFPQPISDNSGEPLYAWADVAEWLQMNGMLPEELAREANSRMLVFSSLDAIQRRRQQSASREIADLLVRVADFSGRAG